MPDSDRGARRHGPEATAEEQRKIQSEQDRHDAARAAAGKEQKPQAKGVPQTGARKQPASPPAQHLEETVRNYGRLDVVVNNAAFQEHADSLEQLSDERIIETLHTNVLGYFHMAREAVPHLRPGASIINTGSVVGLRGSAKLLDYSATKGAIHAFTKSLASNLLDKVAQFGQRTDMKRAAQPEELSPAYVFLAAPSCAGYITGIVLPVTGSVGES